MGDAGKTRWHLWVGVLLLAATVLRLVYLLQYSAEVPFLDVPISDSAYYHAWAGRVMSGEGYGPRPYYMAPLYPTLLGFLYRVTGQRPEVVAYLQSAMGLLSLWLVARLGRRLAGQWAGLMGALLLALYAPFMFVETKVLTETLTITLLLLAVYAGSRALDTLAQQHPRTEVPRFKWRWVWFVTWGVLLGLACLARPNLLALPVFVSLWVIGRAVRRRPVAPASTLALAAAGFVLTIAPFTIRNLVVGRDLVLISSNGGIVFAQGNHPEANGISTILPGFTPSIEEQQEQEMRIASRALGREVSPSESSAFWFRKGLAFALDDPAGLASLWLRKAAWALHAREPRDVYNLYLEAEVVPILDILFMPFPVIFGLAIFGAFRRSLSPGATLCWLGIAAVGATLIVFSMSFRYRLLAVPLLAPFAGAGLLGIIEAFRLRRPRDVGLGLACVVVVSVVSLVPYPIPPITAEAPSNFGAAFLKRGEVGKAFAWVRRALEMDPRLASANYNLGLILLRLKDREGAIAAFEAAVASRPDDPVVLNDLAVALDESGRKEEAVSRYRQALALRPEGRIAYNLALALYDLGRYEESLAALRTAKSLGLRPDPEFERVLNARLGRGGESPPGVF